MPRQRQIKPFLLVLCDDVQRKFFVVMVDDTTWNSRVSKPRNKVGGVRCFTRSLADTREQVIANVRNDSSSNTPTISSYESQLPNKLFTRRAKMHAREAQR